MQDNKDTVENNDLINITSYFLDYNKLQTRGRKTAIYYDDRKISFNDMISLTNKVGNIFKGFSIGLEDRVYIVLPDSPEFVACFYGAIKIGAIFTSAYTFFSAKDYHYEINYIRPKVIVTDNICIDRIRQATAGTKYPNAILIVGIKSSDLRNNEYALSELIANAEEKLNAELTRKDDIAMWKFSGGTTGHRKAIPHRHYDTVWHYEQYSKLIRYTENDKVLAIPKMFFGYGRDGTIVYPFRVGASAILFSERTTVEKICELVERHKPSILIQVPTMIRAMIQSPKIDRRCFSSIRLCISSAETLSYELAREWEDQFGCPVINQIGSAEMYYAYIANEPGKLIPGSVGKVIPGFEAKIVDESNNQVPDGSAGVLMVKGDCAAIQYRFDTLKTRHTFRGEWVYTYDLFKRDNAGNYYYLGRGDDIVKVSGYFVSPLEIEECIQTHPSVYECAVVAVKDEADLEKTKAFIVLKEGVEGTDLLKERIVRYAKDNLSPYKFPRYIEFVTELPKTGLGKVDRLKLKKYKL
jgi:benzoate-CoA ligase family protein